MIHRLIHTWRLRRAQRELDAAARGALRASLDAMWAALEGPETYAKAIARHDAWCAKREALRAKYDELRTARPS